MQRFTPETCTEYVRTSQKYNDPNYELKYNLSDMLKDLTAIMTPYYQSDKIFSCEDIPKDLRSLLWSMPKINTDLVSHICNSNIVITQQNLLWRLGLIDDKAITILKYFGDPTLYYELFGNKKYKILAEEIVYSAKELESYLQNLERIRKSLGNDPSNWTQTIDDRAAQYTIYLNNAVKISCVSKVFLKPVFLNADTPILKTVNVDPADLSDSFRLLLERK